MALRLAVSALARASVLEEGIAQRVCELGGPLTDDGRVRRAHQRWEAVYDRVLAGVRVVGTVRVPAPVESVEEYVTRKSAEARAAREREAGEPPEAASTTQPEATPPQAPGATEPAPAAVLLPGIPIPEHALHDDTSDPSPEQPDGRPTR
jgi:hypothetical protein